MSTSNFHIAILVLTAIAAEALTENRFVAPDDGLPDAGGNTLGVANMSTEAGAATPVITIGTASVEASAAIAKGAAIETLADGRAVTQSSGVTVARAREAATQAGDVIQVLLIQN